MRLQSPDDDLGAMLMPSLPSTVVHRIDKFVCRPHEMCVCMHVCVYLCLYVHKCEGGA